MFEHAIAVAALAVVFAMRYEQITGVVSPDCEYYLKMASGESVPAPYCYRVGLPMFRSESVVKWGALAGTIATVGLVYVITVQFGGGAFAAFCAGSAVVMADALVGCWLHLPWLVDSGSTAWALAAIASPAAFAAVFLVLAALWKESGWALGSVFWLLMGWTWWVPIPGLIALIALRIIITAAPADKEWLESPVACARRKKRSLWFSWRSNLSGMRATPYAACLALPTSAFVLPALGVIVLAWAQTLVAMDHARLIAAAGPFVAPIVAIALPEWALAAWMLFGLFWPFHAEVV